MDREKKLGLLRRISLVFGILNVIIIFHSAVVCNYDMEYGFFGWITHLHVTRVIMYSIVLAEALLFLFLNRDRHPIYHGIMFCVLVFLKIRYLNFEDYREFEFLGYKSQHFLKWAIIMYGGVALLGVIGMILPPLSKKYEGRDIYLKEFFEKHKIPYDISSLEFSRQTDKNFCTKSKVKKSQIVNVANAGVGKSYATYQRFMEILHKNGFDLKQNEYGTFIEWGYDGEVIERLYEKLYPYQRKEILKKIGDVDGISQSLCMIHNGICSAYYQLKGQYDGYAKGERGEEYVEKVLSPLKRKYTLLYNVVVDYHDNKGNTSETDLYVLTPKGIICCEIKNKGNEKYMFEITRDGQWSKCYADGKFIEVMDSPFAQNVRHCLATEEFLSSHGIQDFKIIPLVIIGNEKVRIKNESHKEVIRAAELYDYINYLKLPEKYDEAYLKKVKSLFETYSIKEENSFEIEVFNEELAEDCLRRTDDAIKMILKANDYGNEAARYALENEEKKDKKTKKLYGRVNLFVGTIFMIIAVLMGYNVFNGAFTRGFTPIAIIITILSGIEGVKLIAKE